MYKMYLVPLGSKYGIGVAKEGDDEFRMLNHKEGQSYKKDGFFAGVIEMSLEEFFLLAGEILKDNPVWIKRRLEEGFDS